MLRDAIANLIAAAHIAYFLFVVEGCVVIVVRAHGGKWVRNPWFRLTHIAAVYIVVVENVFNIPCPLNTAEWQLRSASGAAVEASSGIGGLLDQLLFHTVPGNILTVMYYGLVVLLIVALIAVPPRFAKASEVLNAK